MNSSVIYTLKQGKNEYKFYFPANLIAEDIIFSKIENDLNRLNLSATYSNKKYILNKCSIKYSYDTDLKLIKQIENDVTHIAKIYSQFSYTLRKKITPIINDYEYKRFKNDLKNIEDAIKFLARLTSLSVFNDLNDRIHSIIKGHSTLNNSEKLKMDLTEKIKKISAEICNEESSSIRDALIDKVTSRSLEIYHRAQDQWNKASENDLSLMIQKQFEAAKIENLSYDTLGEVKNNNIKINTNFAKKRVKQNFFFSEEAVKNIAEVNNIQISKAAAKRINEKINAHCTDTISVAEYEKMVLNCIKEHEEKIYNSKLFDMLKQNLNKAGFTWTSIGHELTDDFYQYLIKNILYAPQSWLDDMSKKYFDSLNSIKDDNSNIIDSSSRLSFTEILASVPTNTNSEKSLSDIIDTHNYIFNGAKNYKPISKSIEKWNNSSIENIVNKCLYDAGISHSFDIYMFKFGIDYHEFISLCNGILKKSCPDKNDSCKKMVKLLTTSAELDYSVAVKITADICNAADTYEIQEDE